MIRKKIKKIKMNLEFFLLDGIYRIVNMRKEFLTIIYHVLKLYLSYYLKKLFIEVYPIEEI